MNDQFRKILDITNAKEISSGQWLGHCVAHDDQDPSLSLKEENGKTLLKCFSGCTNESVIKELKQLNAWGSDPVERVGGSKTKVAEYIYTNEEGAPHLKVERYEQPGAKKSFLQFHNVEGRWIKGKPKTISAPFLFEKWKSEPSLLFLVEGEKCVEALSKVGMMATTTPGGSSAWNDEYAQYFHGRRVCILPDNDSSGQKYARKVYAALKDKCTITLVNLPELMEGGDVADWLEMHSVEELLDLALNEDHSADLNVRTAALKSTPLSKIDSREMNWLWTGRIPIGCITVLEGDGGVGKSFVIASLASAVSRGGFLPFDGVERPPQKVLLLAAEDDPAVVLRPRFEANNANLSNVECIDQSMLLDKDGLELLKEKIRHEGFKFIIVDPVQSFLRGVDTSKQNEVRSFIQPLHEIAGQLQCSILLVRHFNKNTQGPASHRGNGSVDFRNGSRSLLQLVMNSDKNKFLCHDKSNYGPTSPTLEFAIHESQVEWLNQSELSADEILATLMPSARTNTPSRLGEAENFLRSVLSNCDLYVKELQTLSKDRGLSWATVLRASNTLPLRKWKLGNGWKWELQADEAVKDIKQLNQGDLVSEKESA